MNEQEFIMSLRKNHPHDRVSFLEVDGYDDPGISAHKKRVRRLLEDRLERKRLKEELDDYDGESEDAFDWDHTTGDSTEM
jgi:hypothetical protein